MVHSVGEPENVIRLLLPIANFYSSSIHFPGFLTSSNFYLMLTNTYIKAWYIPWRVWESHSVVIANCKFSIHLPRFLSKLWFLSRLALPTLRLKEVSELLRLFPHSGKLILSLTLVWGWPGSLHMCFVVVCSFGREILLWFESAEPRLWCFLSSIPSHGRSEADGCTLWSRFCGSSPLFLSFAKYLSRLFFSREKSACWLEVGDFCFGQERMMDTLATVGHNGGSTVSDMVTAQLWSCEFNNYSERHACRKQSILSETTLILKGIRVVSLATPREYCEAKGRYLNTYPGTFVAVCTFTVAVVSWQRATSMGSPTHLW